MYTNYYGEDEENVKNGIDRVRKSVRLHDFDDWREDDSNEGE